MTQLPPYHEIDVEALPGLLCTADPMRPAWIWAAVSQRLSDLGVHEIDLALPDPARSRCMTLSPDLLCTDDPMLVGRIWGAALQRLGDLGVRKIDVALPSSQTEHAPSQTRPRKRRLATDIKRIQKATGKRVTDVTFGNDGRVSYTVGAPAAETNPSEAEADEALKEWKRKKNAN